MASKILLPRRGRRSTMLVKNPVLRKGELFLEVPETGVGKGETKVLVGDGVTSYDSLPYAINVDDAQTDVNNAEIEFEQSASSDRATLLDEMVSGTKLPTLTGSVVKFLSVINNAVTSLNNDKADKNHASAKTDYGIGEEDKYGHLKITNDEYASDSDDTAVSVTLLNKIVTAIATGALTFALFLDSGTLLSEAGEVIIMEVLK